MSKLSKAARARRRKAEREWGNVRSLGLSIYKNKRGAFDSEGALAVAVKLAKKAFPGSKVEYGKARKGKRWRASIVFAFPLSREALAKRIGSVPWKGVDRKHARLHLLAGTRNPRKTVPLSLPHAHAREAASEAQDALLTNYLRYFDDEEDDLDDDSIRRAVAKIDRRKTAKVRLQKRDARGRFVKA